MRLGKRYLFVTFPLFFLFGCAISSASTATSSSITTLSSTTQQLTTTTATTIQSDVPTSIHIPKDYQLFRDSFGYSSLIISDRTEVDSGIYQASNEVEFLDALMQPDVKIIEITNDLNLGSIEVLSKLSESGKTIGAYSAVYRAHSHQPLMHPWLIESGIGQIRIHGFSPLMIYSKNGNVIKHSSFSIVDSSDIVIRNLEFSELWEWDEVTSGTYKINDWDYFTVENSQGVWLDHLTIHQSYDGIMDIKEYSSNITLSWSKLIFEPTEFITAQIQSLEENKEFYPFYLSMRDQGISVEDIIAVASYQKKGFNLGNSTDGEGFESISVTFHHLVVENLQDRFPRIRKGDVHLYSVLLDNEDLYHIMLKIGDTDYPCVNQGIVTTEDGAVLMENSRFRYVTSPIKNHQDDRVDSKYTGKYQVINSDLISKTRSYFGSSEDEYSLWIHSGTYESIPFEWRNYENIPYDYYLEDVFFLDETFIEYPPGTTVVPEINWLHTSLNQSN